MAQVKSYLREEIVAWCGLCGRPIHLEAGVVRRKLAEYLHFRYDAAVCHRCSTKEGAWEELQKRADAWLYNLKAKAREWGRPR